MPIYPRIFNFINSSPTTVFVEPTNVCNLHCKTCFGTERPKGYMSPALFRKIIDQLSELHVSWVTLHFGGESLLHPQITEFINYAADKRPSIGSVGFLSNGMLFTKETAELAVNLSLDFCDFSLDGLGKTNDQLRIGANYDKISENMLHLLKLRDAQSRPQINLNFTWSNQNPQDIDSFVSYWAKRVDSIRVNPCIDSAFRLLERSRYGNVAPISSNKFCRSPFTTMGIFWNGDVVACCRDINGLQLMGNAETTPIRDIWFGEKYTSLRYACRKNKFTCSSICCNCEIWKPKYECSSKEVNGLTAKTDGETLTVTYRK